MSDGDGNGDGQQFANERIIDLDIEDELKTSYLTYAMSVIVSRALPDVRDGLKPSQRRILLAMNDLNLSPGSKYKKCARIVGDCMGRYHPHGDSAIYPTLVRMAQSFASRYPLVDGQGNFGSIDGDPPAAMRYTEARMTRPAVNLLEDIEKDTVLVGKNFDESIDEPSLLPGKFPNLLCNGSTGIAVGMATSIPPHNAGEVCDALIALIRDPDITLAGLLEHVKGPDFPTGGYICGRGGILKAYKTGRGLIYVRSKYHVEDIRKKQALIITEIPYQESKENLINKIVHCVKDGRITDISDVRDESDKDGIRLVIELKRDGDPEVVINQLFKFTPLQTTFSIINIALVDSRPETLTLKEILSEYKKHRVIVIRRRTRFLLRKAEHRLHIVQGLLKALDHIDEIIGLIRSSSTVEDAHAGLMQRFDFSDIQAREILQMRLQRLTGLERTKLEDERNELESRIADYNDILGNEQRILDMIVEDLTDVKSRYGDPRRTHILDEELEDFDKADLITEEDVVVTVSREGYIKRSPLTVYKSQGRGGKGIMGFQGKSGDDIKDLFVASTHDYILFFTNTGRVYWKKVYDLPDLSRTSRGRAIINLVQLAPGEEITQQLCVREFDDNRFVIMTTRKGFIKKTPLTNFSRPKKTGIIAVSLDEEDQLIGVAICSSGNDIFLGTRKGMSIRFPESATRAMGRTARGVRGIKLRAEDLVVSMVVLEKENTGPDPDSQEGEGEGERGSSGLSLLTVCEKGYGKRTRVEEYRTQNRAGSGLIDIRTSERNGDVIALKAVNEDDDLVLITMNGQIMRVPVSDMRPIGRNTQGVRVISLREGDKLVSVERVVKSEDEEASEAPSSSAGAEAVDGNVDAAAESAPDDADGGDSSGDSVGEPPSETEDDSSSS